MGELGTKLALPPPGVGTGVSGGRLKALCGENGQWMEFDLSSQLQGSVILLVHNRGAFPLWGKMGILTMSALVSLRRE